MQQTKFQASEQSGFEEEDFEYISMHFHGSNLGPPGVGHLGPWGPDLNKLWKGPCHILN